MRESLKRHEMGEFLALAEHYRALLRETGRSAALLRNVEQGRNVAQEKAEGPTAAYEKEYSETISAAGHVRHNPHRKLACPGRKS